MLIVIYRHCSKYPIELVKPKPSDSWVWKSILTDRDTCNKGKDIQLWSGQNGRISANLLKLLVDTIAESKDLQLLHPDTAIDLVTRASSIQGGQDKIVWKNYF